MTQRFSVQVQSARGRFAGATQVRSSGRTRGRRGAEAEAEAENATEFFAEKTEYSLPKHSHSVNAFEISEINSHGFELTSLCRNG
jgi:hypothetical protein